MRIWSSDAPIFYIEDITRTNVLTSKFLKNLKNNFSFKIEEIITSIKKNLNF